MPKYVVGVDGSTASLAALRWTQQLAARTGAEVEAVSAWAIPPASDVSVAYAIEPLEEAARIRLDRSLAQVPADGVERTGRTILSSSAAWGLIEAAEEADALVVGTRAHSTFERVIGSVAIQCAQHSPVPFFAVPESAPPPGDLVAVAYDGSDSAEAALRWASAIASSSGSRLRVIAVWEKTLWEGGPRLADDPVAPEDRAVEALRAQVAAVVSDIGPGTDYRPVFGPDEVTPHLLAAAEGASLLVVGSRGRGGFTGLLLGSVSQRCLESSPIPVAVIRN